MSYVLIDCTNYTAIARSDQLNALTALAFIQYANVDIVIHPTTENRHYAQFNAEQLQSIYDSCIDASTKKGIGFKTRPIPYHDQIALVRALIEDSPGLKFPYDAAMMEAQAAKIKEDDDRPYMINTTGDTPKRLQKWIVEPNRNRARNAPAKAEQLTRNTGTAAAPLITKPVVKVKKDSIRMLPKANGIPLDDWINTGWTHAQLIKEGYAKKYTLNEKAASRKIKPSPQMRMTRKAEFTHAQYIAAGWIDEQLIAHGYMIAE